MDQDSNSPFLIVGLGNPGREYENTRHNMGFMIVEEFSRRRGASLALKKALLARYAITSFEEKKLVLLLPETYMNLSGQAVRRCMDFYKIGADRLIVISDDVALPFGEFRIRGQGSCGGHNGLKNIEQHLGTQDYCRLRVGVGLEPTEDLADFVLGKFRGTEKELLPAVLKTGCELIEKWLQGGIKTVLDDLAQRKQPKKNKPQDPAKENEQKLE